MTTKIPELNRQGILILEIPPFRPEVLQSLAEKGCNFRHFVKPHWGVLIRDRSWQLSQTTLYNWDSGIYPDLCMGETLEQAIAFLQRDWKQWAQAVINDGYPEILEINKQYLK